MLAQGRQMFPRAVALVLVKPYCGYNSCACRMSRSRVTLAITLAAAIDLLRPSPPTSAVCAMGKSGTGRPSISAWAEASGQRGQRFPHGMMRGRAGY